ncbi:GNAT family N-acetyltransferase [Nocardioides nitrophenolicus]|uniref:GNAT family N-acetyltransferase n=1 Tax=Nocardioides nitrophenolicus TaxID=60489 RepID=UPI00195BAAAB|nr:GNAT family N-acetyltransferase [Nocardioides nitrophenolicus]MBM7518114.1 GNAT superfamily N-acetyltransferase [Nocardioides nitrophenolicus]
MLLTRLTPDHDVTSFRCGNAGLDGWLGSAARTAEAKGTARVYVWPSPGGAVQAYVAVTPHSVDAASLTSRLRRGEPAQIPSYLIAKLALDVGLHGHGLGAALLADALDVIVQASDRGGGRSVVVDAVDDPAAGFYRHHGFIDTTLPRRLVLTVSAARRERDQATRTTDS